MRGPFSPFTGKVKPNLSARYGRGASFLWLATRPDAPEILTGIKPAVAGTLRYGPVGPFGPAVRLETTTDKLTFGTLDLHRLNSTKFSAFVCYRFDQGGIVHRLLDLTGGSAGWSIDSAGIAQSQGITVNSSFVGYSGDVLGDVADGWNTCGFSWETGGTIYQFVNETFNSATLAYNTPPAGNTVRFGSLQSSATAGRGTSIAMVALWPRVLGIQEQLALSRDWRELFSPVRTDIDAGVVSGGTVTGDGSSAGTGTATGVGAATAAGDAASAGIGTAQATGAFTMAATTGVASAVGAGTATAVGAATAAATATSSGLGTALAAGAAIGIISAVGNAAGTSVVLGTSPQLLGGGEAGRGAKGGRRRKRITWLPSDYDIETGERLPQPEVPVSVPAPSVQLSKGERKVARLLAQYRGRDDDVAERARAQLEALRAAEDGALARFIARQEQLDVQRRAAAAIAAEDDEAVVAFMRWMMTQ